MYNKKTFIEKERRMRVLVKCGGLYEPSAAALDDARQKYLTAKDRLVTAQAAFKRYQEGPLHESTASIVAVLIERLETDPVINIYLKMPTVGSMFDQWDRTPRLTKFLSRLKSLPVPFDPAEVKLMLEHYIDAFRTDALPYGYDALDRRDLVGSAEAANRAGEILHKELSPYIAKLDALKCEVAVLEGELERAQEGLGFASPQAQLQTHLHQTFIGALDGIAVAARKEKVLGIATLIDSIKTRGGWAGQDPIAANIGGISTLAPVVRTSKQTAMLDDIKSIFDAHNQNLALANDPEFIEEFFTSPQPQQAGSPKATALAQLTEALYAYIMQRAKVKDSDGLTRQYLHSAFFKFAQNSFDQEREAIDVLLSALALDEEQCVDLGSHRAILRSGGLGKTLQSFVASGQAQMIVGQDVKSLDDFLRVIMNTHHKGSDSSASCF